MSSPMGTPPPPPPPPAPASGPLTCPKCQTANSPGNKFCSACGAPLTVTSPPAPGAPPPPVVDIRQKVDQDRGFLKKLQLLLPGFRGYRQGEDDRAADSILRLQVADRVHRASTIVTTARSSLTNSGDFAHLNDLAQIAAELNMLEGQIRHAEQGYTGISPAVRISVTSLDKLYEYDYGFVQAADTLTETLAPLNVPNPSTANAATAIQNARSVIRQLQAAFQARTKAVQGIQV
ncbi:MAG TPA: zinc ribbon domain-containing protein [Thermoplasmata archaeon]|nr:zinc ribbon domain-containing protein [Thermoplasmata archaeon]